MSYKMAEDTLQDGAKEQYLALGLRDDVVSCQNDLLDGPLYLDGDNIPCSEFDEGAKRFNFSAACERISAALESISDVWVDIQSGEVLTQEPDWDEVDTVTFDGEPPGLAYDPSDYVHFARTQVISAIIGKEFAKYIS